MIRYLWGIYLKQLGRPYDEEKLKADNYLETLIKQDGSRKVIGVNMREEYGDYDGTVCFDDANVEYCLLIPESIIKIREIYQNEQ